MAFGDRLKELRIDFKLTQDELAKKFNTGKSSISNYESNNRLPDAGTIKKYADFFGVSVDYILGHSNDRSAPKKFIGKNLKILRGERTYQEYAEFLTEKSNNQIRVQAFVLAAFENAKEPKDYPPEVFLKFVANVENVPINFFYENNNEIVIEYLKQSNHIKMVDLSFMDQDVITWVSDPKNYALVLTAYNTFKTINGNK